MFSKSDIIFKVQKRKKHKVSVIDCLQKSLPSLYPYPQVIPFHTDSGLGQEICFDHWDHRNLMQRLGKKNAHLSCPTFCCSWEPCHQPHVNRPMSACWMMKNACPSTLAASQATAGCWREATATVCPQCTSEGWLRLVLQFY